MPALLHAATRRELLLGSGALFAWAYVPRVARAEGRDPRFLTIVLRGALDGLAAVAPVGDPDWIKLRGDNALKREGDTGGTAARRILRAQSGHAEPASALSGRPGHRGACGGLALSRALAFRRAGRVGKRARETRPRRVRLAQSRARKARAGRPRVAARTQRRSRSGRSRHWWCAAPRRCCHGCRRGWRQ